MRSPLTGRDIDCKPSGHVALFEEWCEIREEDGTAYIASRDLLDRCQTCPLRATTSAELLRKVRAYAGEGLSIVFATEVQGMLLARAGRDWAGLRRVYCVVSEP